MSTPVATDTFMLPDPVGHSTEFLTDPVNGTKYTGICTQTATMVALAAAAGVTLTPALICQLAREMIRDGQCAKNGGSRIDAIAAKTRAMGPDSQAVMQTFQTPLEWDFGNMGDWVAELRGNANAARGAGHVPYVLQVANGSALVDAETGARDEAGLQYHAIAIVGKSPKGYTCADGDNSQANERFQIYTLATLGAAQPCGLFAVTMKRAATEQLPTGATDDGAAIHYNGYQIIGSFRDWMLAKAFPMGAPLENAWSSGNTMYQMFQYGELASVGGQTPSPATIGAYAVNLRNQVDTMTKQLAAIRAALGSAA